MGTSCEIVVANKDYDMVVLYKHWDSYPSTILGILQDAGDLMAWMARDQRHWLTYPTDVASFIIFYDGLLTLEEANRINRGGGSLPFHIDMRPVDNLADYIEYLYVVNLSKGNRLKWDVAVYDVHPGFWDLGRKERDEVYARIINGTIPPLGLKLRTAERLELKPQVPRLLRDMFGILAIAEELEA